jgi:putative toxin-antitoxin system antitoxin component (TIGR02293 family)
MKPDTAHSVHRTKISSSRANRREASYASREDDLGLNARTTDDLIQILRDGLPYRVWPALIARSGIEHEVWASWVGIHPRTLHRRKDAGRFEPQESERLYRFTSLFERVLGLFEGDRKQTFHWLTMPKRALYDKSPVEYAQTELGAREVDNLIGRLEHGVFS